MRLLMPFLIAAALFAILAGCEVKQTGPKPSLKVLAPDFLEGILEPAVEQFGAEHAVRITVVYDSPDSIGPRLRRDGSFDLVFAVSSDPFDAINNDFWYRRRHTCPFRLAMAVVGRAGGPVITGPDDLAGDDIKRIVILDPERAYEGRIARYILEKRRLWNDIRSKTIAVRSRDQAYSYMKTGEADAAVIFEASSHGREGLVVAGRLEKGIGNRLTVCGAVAAASKQRDVARALLDLFDSDLCKIYKQSGIYQID